MGKLLSGKKSNARIPFYKEIMDSKVAKSSSRIKMQKRQENHEEKIIDSKITQQILTEAKKQLDDIEEEFGLGSLCKNFQISHMFDGLPEEKNTIDVSKQKENFAQDTFLEEIGSYQNNVPEDVEKKNVLVEHLREKITEKRTEVNTVFSDVEAVKELNEEVLAIFKNAAIVLSTFRSGRLPKSFKALPKLRHWEQLLNLTEPENWTAAAMFQATRLFASNLNSEMAQRFYNLILLPRVRDDIAQCKKLNPHLYQAVEKAIFKPRAFFKGIIIPLCESGNCTFQEATIISNILAKRSIPIIHSSVALFLISRMPFSCTNCIFMRVLIEKKYSLYNRVIDGLVDFFLRSVEDDKRLPIFWHQCLLAFVKHYKNDLSEDKKKKLLDLLKVHSHHKISPEISKELLSTFCQNRET